LIDLTTIKWLQIEATTKCNAWCPGCKRNDGGYKLSTEFVIEDLTIPNLRLALDQLPNLTTIDFCGTYGDAIAASNIIEQISLAKLYSKKIIIRTNGSLRNTEWWKSVAILLSDIDHEVWFCLDGLSDTHSIYRQGTDFDTIIKNATTFISTGGTAVWQFIPWKHNEHQIKDCIRMSQQLGFKRFEFIRDVRKDFESKHYQTGQLLDIQPWGSDKKLNRLEQVKTQVLAKNCRHLSQPSVYLNATGKLSNCCFFNNNISSDNINDLPDIINELDSPRPICMKYCGI
jgi:MoaA/NifB/PqqE/SkfB family radical SAM enzyme